MPRNSGGQYSLPTGNPVTTATAISSTWANNTLTDLKTEMTDSLSRSGKGAMLAQLQLFDGTVSAPGVAFGSDTNTGFYGGTADVLKLSVGGGDVMWWSPNASRLGGTAPAYQLEETDAAADNKIWDFIATGEDLKFRALTDALVATNWLTVTRTGNTIDAITISATNITLNGYTPTITGGLASLTGDNAMSGANTFSGVNLIEAADALWRWKESDASANNKFWQCRANGEQFLGQALTDALAATSWIVVDRTAGVIDLVNFPGTAVTVAGTLGVTGTSTLGAVNAGVMTGTSFAGAVAATTLSASSTVSGNGFSTYLASPPAIGTTAPAGGRFTFAHTAPVVVTWNATTMAVDCALSNVFTIAMTGNVTSAMTMSNAKDGQTINVFITQDATGSRTMVWPASFKWPGGTTGTLTTTANAIDLIVATWRSATSTWACALTKDFK